MIRRYDAYSEGQEDDGRFVFYEDHIAEIIALSDITYGIERSLRRDLAEAKKDLALNASMLARQTDLARDAETIANRQAKEIKRLNKLLSLAWFFPEKEQP